MKIMFNSIAETQKLFKVERIKKDGQVDVKTTEYLLSLSGDEQRKVLTTQLADLRKDLAKLKNPFLKGSIGEGGNIQAAQLQILIGVIEGLLYQI
jgi:hypothetical protein